MFYLLLPLLVIGHLAIHISFINRLHGTGLARWVIKVCDLVWYLSLVGLPLAFGMWYLQRTIDTGGGTWQQLATTLAILYGGCCLFAALIAIWDRWQRARYLKTTDLLLSNHTRMVSLPERVGHLPVGNGVVAFAARLPFNEIMQISVHEKRLRLPRLPTGLEGLRLTHLSDLHLTGQLSRDYYRELVELVNEWPADIVAITGDIVEKVRCLDWIAPTLGALRATHGVYFVLGNHDVRINDEARTRQALTDAGLIDLGKRWEMVVHAGSPLLLAGNELPWFKPAADLRQTPEKVNGERPLRIVLSHSPDQLGWARDHDCDLMLAGHTHGGQIRIPGIGPILSPSLYGSRHASGTFYYEPTVLHVSRGIAGTRPLRLNCPPEVAHLVCTAKTESATSPAK